MTTKDLSFEEQPVSCIDIYQALTVKRPYNDGMTHGYNISVVLDMAHKGELNEKIVHYIDKSCADSKSVQKGYSSKGRGKGKGHLQPWSILYFQQHGRYKAVFFCFPREIAIIF